MQRRIGVESLRLADLARSCVEDEHVVGWCRALAVGIHAAPFGGLLNAGAADPLDKLAGGQQGLVAHHLGREAEDGSTSEVAIGWVLLATFRRRRRGLSEGRAEDHAPQHGLRVPFAADEVHGQGVQQFRVRGQVTLQAQVLAGGDESRAKDLSPETINNHARGQGMLRVRQPLGEAETVVRQGVVPREDARRHAGFTGLGQLRLVVFAAGEHVGLGSDRRMFHRREGRGRLLMCGEGATGLLDAFPGLGEGGVGTEASLFGLHGRRQGSGIQPVKDRDFGGRQGGVPELDLVERAVAEACVAGTGADLQGIVSRLGMERVAYDRRLHLASIEVHVQPSRFGGTIVGDRHSMPLAHRKLLNRLDGGGAVGPEVDHAPAELPLVHQQFDAGRVAIARVETGRVKDRRTDVLFTEAEEARERECIKAP